LENIYQKTINEHEQSKWMQEINKTPKLRTYGILKSKLCFETYLLTSNHIGRKLMFTLRCGTNKLEIETGRWANLEEEKRLCRQCDLKLVENEQHFMVICPLYHDERKQLYNKIYQVSNSKWDISLLDHQTQFTLLMKGTGDKYECQIFNLVQKFIMKSFNIRNGDT
jgi:hypothetical protein